MQKNICWNEEKNKLLKEQRGISFDIIKSLIEREEYLEIIDNPNYKHQKSYIFNIFDYIVIVPFVETESEIFLKTIYPSRKFNKLYGKLKDET